MGFFDFFKKKKSIIKEETVFEDKKEQTISTATIQTNETPTPEPKIIFPLPELSAGVKKVFLKTRILH